LSFKAVYDMQHHNGPAVTTLYSVPYLTFQVELRSYINNTEIIQALSSFVLEQNTAKLLPTSIERYRGCIEESNWCFQESETTCWYVPSITMCFLISTSRNSVTNCIWLLLRLLWKKILLRVMQLMI